MKTLKTFIPAIILLGLTLVWHACTKKDHTDPDDFFEKQDDLAFFKAANGNLAKVDFLNRTIDRFKILDQSQHFAGKLQSWYGDAKWNMTIVVNNKDGLYTLITPFVNDRDTVTALLFAYHTDQGSTTIYRLYNKENYKRYFDYTGSKGATTINRSTVEGWFGLFSKTHQRLKNVQEGKTLPRTIFYEWECIRYTWTTGSATDGSTGFGMSDWQCTMNIHDDGNNGGGHIGELEDDLEEPEQCGGQPCPGGGPVTTWTYTEISTANFSIIDSLQGYPCAQNILARLPNINNKTKEILQNIFGVNDEVNISFKSSTQLPLNTSGTASAGGPLSNFKAIVRIDENVLIGASNDYIAATMIHEALHAYFIYQRQALDTLTFATKFPNYWGAKNVVGQAAHYEMAANYVQMMTDVLIAYNPNILPNVAKALAWGGLQNTTAWKQPGLDTTSIKNLNAIASNPTLSQYKQYKLLRCTIAAN
jgi:hypothetical protein